MRSLKVGVIIFSLMVVLVPFGGLVATAKTLYQIGGIEINEKDDFIEIAIDTTDEPLYKILQLNNPPRFVIDFLNATSGLTENEVLVDRIFIQRVRLGQYRVKPVKIVRVVIDVKESLDPRISTAGNRLVAQFPKGTGVVVSTSPPEPIKQEVEEKRKEELATEKGLEEEQVAVVEGTEVALPSPLPELVKEEAKGEESTAPQGMVQVKEEKKREVPRPKKKPPKEEPKEKKVAGVEKKILTPPVIEEAPLVIEEPKISLDVKNADLLDVLRLIGHKAAVNIVPSKDVSGTVTIRIENTPWEQVLDVVLRSQGYIYFHDKGLIRVGREEDFVLEMTTQIIPLKYAKASDIVSVLQPHIGKGGGLGVDERTNSLIITDTPKNVVNMREIIIKGLDIRTRQVLIEAKIVQVSETGLKQLGIRWVVDDAKDRGLYTKDAYAGGRYVDKYTRGTTNPGIPDRDPFGTFSFGFVSGTFNIDAALAALESQGEGSILSSPSVLVAHNQKATITSGKSIPMLTTTAGPGGGIGQTVTYRDVCITMTVTPKIAPDDYISLKVNPRVESVDEVRIAGYPDLTTSSIETDLLVRDGDTVVIGGVIKDEHTQTIQKVPFLGDIPFLGRLFQGKKSKIEKSELLIFIRTKIIRETE